jgi:hypothetical protein
MKYFLWILGFLVGLFVPAAVAFFVALAIPGGKPYGDPRAGFFACLGSSLLLTMSGIAGWRRFAFLRGVACGSGVWLAILPAIAGDCAK